MRIRAVLVFLGLLMFIICTANISEAAEWYKSKVHHLAPPNEHPWQDYGSPPVADTLIPEKTSSAFILIGPFKFVKIEPPQVRFHPARITRTEDHLDVRDPK